MSSHDDSPHASLRRSYHDADVSNYVAGEDMSDGDEEVVLLNEGQTEPTPSRAHFIRALALLCACSLSIGSH